MQSEESVKSEFIARVGIHKAALPGLRELFVKLNTTFSHCGTARTLHYKQHV